jgi:4-oxalocrotonate tautomerase
MPHVIVKLYSGKSERQKQALAQAVTQAVAGALGYGEASVSVGIEDVEPKDWTEKVYKPDIIDRSGNIYKKPGYDPR